MKLIKFEQTSCVPCQILKNILGDLGVEVDQNINLSNGIDEEVELAGEFGIMSTPTLLLVDDENKEVARCTGANADAVNELLAKRA